MTRPSRRRGALLAGFAAVTLTIVAGCSGASDDPVVPTPDGSAPTGSTPAASSPTSTAPSPTASPPTSGAPSPSASADTGGGSQTGSTALLGAGETAATAVADGVVVAIDPERRGTVWEVDVVTADGGQQQVVVSADGSEVVSGPTDDRPDAEDQQENRQLVDAAVDYREAVELAETEVGGTVTQLSLDSDDGRLGWELDVDAPDGPRDVVLDARDGTVLSNEADD